LIILASSGIAAVMAWAPASIDRFSDVSSPETISSRHREGARRKLNCGECGVVESMREISLPRQSTTSSALAQLPVTYPREKPQRTPKRYEVTVRMTDGTSRVFIDPHPERWHSGSRVVIIDGERPVN
jgi:ribosomal protein S27AE